MPPAARGAGALSVTKESGRGGKTVTLARQEGKCSLSKVWLTGAEVRGAADTKLRLGPLPDDPGDQPEVRLLDNDQQRSLAAIDRYLRGSSVAFQ